MDSPINGKRTRGKLPTEKMSRISHGQGMNPTGTGWHGKKTVWKFSGTAIGMMYDVTTEDHFFAKNQQVKNSDADCISH